MEVFEEYVRLYSRRLFGLCMKLCRSADDAQELYQQAWLRAMEKYGSFDKNRSFESWIVKITVNLYSDMLRKKRLRTAYAELEQTCEPELPDGGELEQAVQRLPEKLRSAVILYYYNDLSIKQTAEALSVPQGTVKSRLNKAKRLLKEALEAEE